MHACTSQQIPALCGRQHSKHQGKTRNAKCAAKGWILKRAFQKKKKSEICHFPSQTSLPERNFSLLSFSEKPLDFDHFRRSLLMLPNCFSLLTNGLSSLWQLKPNPKLQLKPSGGYFWSWGHYCKCNLFLSSSAISVKIRKVLMQPVGVSHMGNPFSPSSRFSSTHIY